MISSFSPTILSSSIMPEEYLRPNHQSKTKSCRGTLFINRIGKIILQLNDSVILPCLITKEKLTIFGIESTPISNGLFQLGQVKFAYFGQFGNWIAYFEDENDSQMTK